MGNVFIPELGANVSIEGDSPNAEERRKIDAAIARRRAASGPSIQQQVQSQPQGFEPSLRRPAAELGAGQVQQEEAARQSAQRREAVRSFVGPAAGGLAALTAATGGLSAPVTVPGALAAAAGGAVGSALSQAAVGGEVDPRKVAEEGTFEGLSAGVGALGLGGLRLGAKRFANVDEAQQALNRRFGLSASLEDLSGGGIVRGARETVGQVPFLGAPFRKSARRRASDISDSIKRTLGFTAPSGTALESIDDAELGPMLFKRATGRFKAFQRLASAKKREMDRIIDADPEAFVPISFSKAAAEAILDASGSQVVPGRSIATRTASQVLKGPENLSVKQYRQLQKAIAQKKAAAARGAQKGDPVVEDLFELEKALEKDFMNLQGGEGAVDAMKDFSTFFHEGMKQFESPVAKSFARADRNAFKFGFQMAGDLQPDELATKLFSQSRVIDSPKGVNEIRGLVGAPNFQKAVARHLERKIDEAVKIERGAGGSPTGSIEFSRDALERSLGLYKPRTARRAATEEMLRGTGVTAKDLEGLFSLVEKAAEQNQVNASRFLARRIALSGGIGALAGSGFVAGGGGGLAGGGVLGLMAIRGFGEAITNPKALKIAEGILKPGVSQTAVTQGLFRMGRVMGVDPLQTRELIDNLESAPRRAQERLQSVSIPAL